MTEQPDWMPVFSRTRREVQQVTHPDDKEVTSTVELPSAEEIVQRVGTAIRRNGSNRVHVPDEAVLIRGGRQDLPDAEDPNTLPRRQQGRRNGAQAVAVWTGPRLIDREDQQVLPDRHIILRPATTHVREHARRIRLRDVDDLEAIVVAGNRQVAPKRQVRLVIRPLAGGIGLRDIGEEFHVVARTAARDCGGPWIVMRRPGLVRDGASERWPGDHCRGGEQGYEIA